MREAATPPARPYDDAARRYLDIAAVQGEAYRVAIEAMAVENGLREAHAGGYVIGFTTEAAEGMYTLRDGRLAWTGPGGANSHLQVVVADAADGRFVPQLDVTVTALAGSREVLSTELPFLWHPFLYYYGTNVQVPGRGPFDVAVRVAAPRFVRHGPAAGRRYAEPAETVFTQVRFNTGVNLSPEAPPGAGR